jgi:hypothetical protein
VRPFIDEEAAMSQNNALQKPLVQEILRAVESVRFGSIEITVHEGRVTQIEKREKVRFTSQPLEKAS